MPLALLYPNTVTTSTLRYQNHLLNIVKWRLSVLEGSLCIYHVKSGGCSFAPVRFYMVVWPGHEDLPVGPHIMMLVLSN